MDSPNNRAISAIFRVFGEKESTIRADATDLTNQGGINRQETFVFAILIPTTAFVGIGEFLSHLLGPLVGWLLAIPATFLFLQLLPFLLNAKSQTIQWRLWLAICVAWAIYRCHATGIVGTLAYVWLAIGAISLTAKLILIWQATMKWRGKLGTLWRFVIILIPHMIAIAIGIRFGWPWGILCGAAIAAFFCEAILNPYSQTLGPVVCKKIKPDILISIDDGPSPEDTPRILELLDQYQSKAIFFMIGEKISTHPDLAREVIRRGHEIGNHTHTHPQASFWCAGPWRTYREISQCQTLIEETTGIKPRWFRAPVGHRNLFTHPIASALGLQVMAWNRRGFDAVETNASTVLARILPFLTKGDIVLLHEATPIATEVLESVLKKISE